MMKYDLYHVKWVDACVDYGWKKIGETRVSGILVHTAGWLLETTKDFIVVAQSISAIRTSSERMEIPRRWVKSMQKIKGHTVEYQTTKN